MMAAPINGVRRVVAAAGLLCLLVPNTVARSHELAQAAFDVGTERMPVRFQGNTVEWVLRYGTLAPRNAFESDSDYAARRRAFRSEVFAFVPDHFEIRYDRAAEAIIVLVRPAITPVDPRGGDSLPAFDVRRTKLSVATHAGPPRWSRNDRPVAAERGAVLSTTRVWRQTQIVMNDGMFNTFVQPLAFKLHVPRDRTAAVKSNLHVALICMPRLDQYELAGDAVMPEATGIEVKIDGASLFPDQSITYLLALKCTLLQVWLFDFRTGEVYGRFTPQGVHVPR
jgi:hypothetical protein